MTEQKKQPIVYFDHRENRSGRVSALEMLGAELRAGQETDFETGATQCLSVGDYVASDRVGIEVKAIEDFLKSFIEDRKLFSQIFDLMRAYKRPILIIEGEADELFTQRMITPEAMRGILQRIAISFKTPCLYTKNVYETAKTIYEIAEYEQREDKDRNFAPHGKRSHLSPKKKKEYVVTSFPDCGVGPEKAIKLLNHFENIENIMKASSFELMKVDGIGPKIAANIRALVTEKY